jgi:hypothetical protein
VSHASGANIYRAFGKLHGVIAVALFNDGFLHFAIVIDVDDARLGIAQGRRNDYKLSRQLFGCLGFLVSVCFIVDYSYISKRTCVSKKYLVVGVYFELG